MSDDSLNFLPEEETEDLREPWDILIVDDEDDVHRSTLLALNTFEFQDRPLRFTSAHSASEAIEILNGDTRFAVMFLDVVMESDDAGFKVLSHVREVMGNDELRVILRTGQPGQAPAVKVVTTYDINDYRAKAELTFEKLIASVCTCLRMYSQICELHEKQRELEAMNRSLEALTRIDQLTKIANRRVFDETLFREWSRCARSGIGLAVYMIDVDYFKQYNDSLGHTAGDEALCKVAEILNEKLQRAGDLLARYGGEEFVAIVPDTDIKKSVSYAQTIVEAVRQASIAHPDSKIGDVLTISIGVAVQEPARGVSPQLLIEQADKALYMAKANGRNRVETLANFS